jgi:hypothetical protein
MALTCDQIIAIALEASHGEGKYIKARQLLNSILSDLCQEYDIAAARGQYVFTFHPGLTAAPPLPQTPASTLGSGPYYMPADYLRLSGSSGSTGAQRSFTWWLNGVAYSVIPYDLAEFDIQVQQSGLSAYVWMSATDMSSPLDDRILLSTSGSVTSGSTSVTSLYSVSRLAAGLGVAGQGIVPGTTVVSVDPVNMSCVLSQAANATAAPASLLFGYPPTMWIYPPPISAQQAMIRYQKRMPDIVDFSRYPWFTSEKYLIRKLTGALCMLNDDTRAGVMYGGPEIPGSPDNELTSWLAAKDDDANRPKTVGLDRRRFGSNWNRLPNTKTVGF